MILRVSCFAFFSALGGVYVGFPRQSYPANLNIYCHSIRLSLIFLLDVQRGAGLNIFLALRERCLY